SNDKALLTRACELGDPVPCFDDQLSADPSLSAKGLQFLQQGCLQGVAADCFNFATRTDDVSARDAARDRGVSLAASGCEEGDLVDCELAGKISDDSDVLASLRAWSMACVLNPGDCREVAELYTDGKVAPDLEAARAAYERSCLSDADATHVSYGWQK